MTVTLNGQTVLVIGGGRGVGRAAALACAAAGGKIIVAARSQEEIQAVAQEASQGGGSATLALPCDVSDFSSVERVVTRALERFGRLDVVVNTAGVIHPVVPVWRAEPAAWRRNLDVNLIGAFHVTRAVLAPMIEARRGRIIHVSSGAAAHAVFGWSAYCAGKAGLDHFVRVAAQELASSGIAIYSVYPGIVDTRMQEGIRRASPEDFGEENLAQFKAYHERRWLRPPEEPAQLVLYLATAGDLARSGQVFNLDDQAVRHEMARALKRPVLPGQRA